MPPPPKAKPKVIPPKAHTKAVGLPPGRVPPSLRQFSRPLPLPPGRVDPLVYEEYEKMEVGRVEVEKEVGGGGQSSQQQTGEPKMMEVEKDDVEKMVEKEKVEKMVGKEEVETMVEKEEVEKMVETEEVEKMVETEKVETMVEKEEVEQMEVEPVHVDVVDEVETVTAERSLQAKSACRPMMDLRRLQRGVLDESLPIGFLESGSDAVLSILTTNHDSETLLASTGWRPSGYVPTRAPLSDTSPADS